MAILKKMLLPLVGLLCVCVVTVNAADVGEGSVPDNAKAEVADVLADGEASLTNLLGKEVEPLDKVLKAMIEEMAKSYGVSEKELALVAREVMHMVSTMSPEELRDAVNQVTDLSAPNGPDAALIQQLLGGLLGASAPAEEI